MSLGDAAVDFVYRFSLIPYRFLLLAPRAAGEILTPVTAMFLHGGWMHVIGNMLYLYIFGDNVEDRLGRGRFLVFYLACGVLSFLVQVLFNARSMVPNIGASGAIAGVLGAYLVLFPRARVLTIVPLLIFFPVVEIPAFVFLGFWFLIQFLSGAASLGASSPMAGGIAWWAHIGGFLAGIVLLKVLLPRDPGARPSTA